MGRDVYAGNTSQGIFLFYCGSVTPEPFFTDTGPELKAIEPAIEVLRAMRMALMILLTEIRWIMSIRSERQDLNPRLEKSMRSHPQYRPNHPRMSAYLWRNNSQSKGMSPYNRPSNASSDSLHCHPPGV